MKRFIFVTLFLLLGVNNLFAAEISTNKQELSEKIDRCSTPGNPLYASCIYVKITNENLLRQVRCHYGLISPMSDGDAPVVRTPGGLGFGCALDMVQEVTAQEYNKYFSELTAAYEAQQAALLKAYKVKKRENESSSNK
jgi:N-methylhydantoinase B/oxoprolinase/acetone carboxylase alpha subunit